MMLEQIASHLAALAVGGTVGTLAMAVLAAARDGGGAMCATHAWKLGRECLVRTGDGRWEPHAVVAVSHKGALAVRPLAEPDAPARWIRRSLANDPSAVRFRGGPEGA